MQPVHQVTILAPMETRKPKWKDRAAFFAPSGETPGGEAQRRCDHEDCAAEGRYRAPRSQQQLADFHWFCIDHIREYNARWDYYRGMTEAEIEACRRRDTIWDRPTWPFGAPGVASAATAGGRRPGEQAGQRPWTQDDQPLRDAFERAFGFEGAPSGSRRNRQNGWSDRAWSNGTPRGRTSAEDEALSVLDLDYPVDFATVRARYKVLVKEHHPDRHGGSRTAEEKLKAINLAYSTLKSVMAP